MNTTRSAEQGRIRIPVGPRITVVTDQHRRFLAFALAIYFSAVVGVCLYAQDAPACPARTAHVLTVDAPGWNPSLVITTATGGTAKLTPCNLPFSTATLPADGAFAVDDWNSLLTCGSSAAVRVVDIPVQEGSCLTYSTEAVYRDGDAVVEIPELHAPLAAGNSIRFAGIRTDAPRSTFIALVARDGGLTRAAVTLFDGEAAKLKREVVYVDGFTWYEVPAGVSVGSVDVENIGSGLDDGAGLYAVAFAGYRDGGSPRVIQGEVRP